MNMLIQNNIRIDHEKMMIEPREDKLLSRVPYLLLSDPRKILQKYSFLLVSSFLSISIFYFDSFIYLAQIMKAIVKL